MHPYYILTAQHLVALHEVQCIDWATPDDGVHKAFVSYKGGKKQTLYDADADALFHHLAKLDREQAEAAA